MARGKVGDEVFYEVGNTREKAKIVAVNGATHATVRILTGQQAGQQFEAPWGVIIAEKDTYAFQKARVEKIIEPLCPECLIEFDPSPLCIRFRVLERRTRAVLSEFLQEFSPSELADKPDEWIRDTVVAGSNGKIRIR